MQHENTSAEPLGGVEGCGSVAYGFHQASIILQTVRHYVSGFLLRSSQLSFVWLWSTTSWATTSTLHEFDVVDTVIVLFPSCAINVSILNLCLLPLHKIELCTSWNPIPFRSSKFQPSDLLSM
jgi:hypothetical protein